MLTSISFGTILTYTLKIYIATRMGVNIYKTVKCSLIKKQQSKGDETPKAPNKKEVLQ